MCVGTAADELLAQGEPPRIEAVGRVEQLPGASTSAEARYSRALFGVPRPPYSLVRQAFAGVIVAYAVSPLDLIPDFVPVLGYLDDLVIIPAGLMLSLKLIPPPVLTECREEPQLMAERPTSRVGIVVVVSVWLSAVVPTALLLARPFELI